MGYDYKNKNYYTFKDGTGKTYELKFSDTGGDGYYTNNNPFDTYNRKQLAMLVQYYLSNGQIPDRITFNNATGSAVSEKGWEYLIKDLGTFAVKNNLNMDEYSASVTEQNKTQEEEGPTLDRYFDEWYNTENPDTTGAKVLQNLEGVYENQAANEGMLADAVFQQQALQQAQVVKNITDQVRNERMARLRAGLSEAQIANQDMQMMMANVNALNEQAGTLGQQRLQAQVNKNTAKDQAYLAYLEQAQIGSQTGAAYSAANASDPYIRAIDYMKKNPGITYEDAYKVVSGQNLNS